MGCDPETCFAKRPVASLSGLPSVQAIHIPYRLREAYRHVLAVSQNDSAALLAYLLGAGGSTIALLVYEDSVRFDDIDMPGWIEL